MTKIIALICGGNYKLLLVLTIAMFCGQMTKAQIDIINTTLVTTGCNGTIDVIAQGTAGPFSIYVNGNENPVVENLNGTFTIENLCIGDYTIVVENPYMCETTLETEVMECPDVTMGFNFTTHESSCGAEDGILFFLNGIGGVGGTPPYTFEWSNESTDLSQFNLASGDYTVTVTDINGCTGTRMYTINPGPLPVGILSTNSMLSNGTDCDGSLEVTIDNTFFAPYTISLNLNGNEINTTNLSSGSFTFENLCAGMYSIEILNDAGCRRILAAEVINCNIDLNATTSNAGCDGNSGTINLNPTGGTSPYTYIWADDIITQNRTELTVGQYCVTVTDINNCTIDDCFFIRGQLSFPINLVNKTNDSYCGSKFSTCNGSIDISVPLMGGPYTFNWSGDNNFSSSSEDINNLCKGNYFVTVTEAGGCESTANFNLCCCEVEIEPGQGGDPALACYINAAGLPFTPPISFSGQPIPISETGQSDGSIDLSIVGGLEEIIISWQGPNGYTASTQDISNLSIGEYCVTVSDGCSTEEECYNIIDCGTNIPIIDANPTNTCEDVSYGRIDLTITGGTPPYDFIWSNGANTQDLENLSLGVYQVTVADVNGCRSSGQIEIYDINEITSVDVTAPCERRYSCNNEVIDELTEPFEATSNFISCTVQSITCSLTGESGQLEFTYSGTEIDYTNCDIYGICPSDGVTRELIEDGISKSIPRMELIQPPPPDCGDTDKCFTCFFYPGCEFLDGFMPTPGGIGVEGNLTVSPIGQSASCPGECEWESKCDGTLIETFCDPCPGLNPNSVNSDPSIATIFNNAKKTGHLSMDKKLFLPVGASPDLTMKEYTILFGGQTRAIIYEVDPNLLKEEKPIALDKNYSFKVDAKEKYSKEITKTNSENNQSYEMVYPNPFANYLNIEAYRSNEVNFSVSILNSLGQIITTNKFLGKKGINIFEVDTKDILPGRLYFVKIEDQFGKISIHRMVKNY